MFAISFASLLALVGCTVWGEHRATAWSDITGGESLERVFWHEVQGKRWTELESHLSSNYALVTPEGTFDRSGAIEHWKKLEIHDYSIGELSTELNGNTYTVTYILNLRGKENGQPLPATTIRAMTVWQRQVRDTWNAIAHSEVPATTSQNK